MDVIASIKAGLNNAVATMGTALTNDHIKTLLNLTKNITLCFDGDSAGINAMKRNDNLRYATFSLEKIEAPRKVKSPKGSKIRKRIENILSYKKISGFSIIAFSALIIAICYVLLTNAS